MLKYVTLFVVLVAFLSSCGSNNPVGVVGMTYRQPKVGDSFTIDNYKTDTATGQPVPGSRHTSVDTFAQTGMKYMGKTNVTQIVSTSGVSNYLNYEANNDISIFEPNTGGIVPLWITFPVGSKSSITTIISDTSAIVSGVPIEMKLSAITSYVDDETMIVKGQTLSVVKIKQQGNLTITTAGVPKTQTNNAYLYYAPSLGYVAKAEIPISVDPNGVTKSQGTLNVLIDYTLK